MWLAAWPVDLLQRFDEVVVFGAAVLAASHLAEFAEERLRRCRIESRFAAVLADQATLAAGDGSKHVVGVHRADDERVAVPLRFAVHTRQLSESAATEQTRHAHGVEIHHAALALHLQVGIVALWRQEEGAVDERILVIHRKLAVTDHAAQFRNLVIAQICQDKATRFVISVRTYTKMKNTRHLKIGCT